MRDFLENRNGRGEQGFTLIELLVVILIIGILASIALPSFISQRDKGHDAGAKADVRNMVGAMEDCYVATADYAQCEAILAATPGLIPAPYGTDPGEISITVVDTNSYTAQAVSRAKGGGANHLFRIVSGTGGVFGRECEPLGEGGCPDSGIW